MLKALVQGKSPLKKAPFRILGVLLPAILSACAVISSTLPESRPAAPPFPAGTRGGVFRVDPSLPDLHSRLTRGFWAAFSDPEAFRRTRLFDAIGYSPQMVKSMIEVTPRPASISVEFKASLAGEGHFDLIRVVAEGVRYYNLTIHHAVFEFPQVILDPRELEGGKLIFRTARSIDLETFVSERDILKVFDLFAKARSLSDLRLSLKARETVLSGRCRKGILTMAFRVVGKPEVAGTSSIRFDCRKLLLNGLSLPRGAINAIFNRINPVFDARRSWLNLSIRNLIVERGFVRTRGTILSPVGTGPNSGG